MSPIISSLSSPPSEDFHRKKILLNEEFHNKAKIQGLVSYIYYPSQGNLALLGGHAELEIEGCSHTLMDPSDVKTRILSKMINSSESGRGFPFFRFQISVTPNQLKDLRDNSLTTLSPLCSMGVAKALSRHGKYTIPLPVTFSPFVSAIYLTCTKILGSQRINDIKFYGGKKQIMNLAKCIPGVALECLYIYKITGIMQLSLSFLLGSSAHYIPNIIKFIA